MIGLLIFIEMMNGLYGNNLKSLSNSYVSGKELNKHVKTFFNSTKERSIPLENDPFWASCSHAPGMIWGTHLVDITGDGYPEVITIWENEHNYLYLNNGGFIDTTPSWQSIDNDRHVQASFGDYDNDGDLDMAVASYGFAGGSTKLYRNDNGILTREPIWEEGSGIWCGWGDVDNDGDLDLAMVDEFISARLFINDSGTLENSPSWVAADYNIDFSGAWGDIDNDGDLDLIVGGLNTAEPLIRVYYNTNGMLETTASWSSVTHPNPAIGIFVIDINRDGWLDVAVSTGFVDNTPNFIFINNNGILESEPSWISDDMNCSGFCTFGDMNGDGLLDWSVNNGNCGIVYENIGDSLNRIYSWSSTPIGGLGVDVGDIDRDGILVKEDTLTGDGIRNLFYLSTVPVIELLEITIDGVPLPVTDYTGDLKCGWITFKNIPPSGSRIIVKYEHSIDLEFLLSATDPVQKAYLFRNNTINIKEKWEPNKFRSVNIFPSISYGSIWISGFLPLGLNSEVVGHIYSSSGEKLISFRHEPKTTGFYKIRKNLNLSSGEYILQLKAGKEFISKKFIILR